MITKRTIDISKFKKELEKREVKENVKTIFSDTCEWVKENPVMAAVIFGAIAWTIKTGHRTIVDISRRHAAEKLIEAQNSRIYDHSLGSYIQLKKPLTNLDICNIYEIQQETGYRIPDIVRQMGLAK